MVTTLVCLNAVNLYLILNYAEVPVNFKELLAALNPEKRKSLRFYFVSLWGYFSITATLVCILLPFAGRYAGFTQQFSDRIALLVAVLIELTWLFYAVAVFSWRLSGYLYKSASSTARWAIDRALDVIFPNRAGQQEL
jgi:hypothetical protein